MPTTENVCMKIDARRSARVTNVGRTSNSSAWTHRRYLTQPKGDSSCGKRPIVVAASIGSKVEMLMKVAVDGPGTPMMGEGQGASCCTAHDGHVLFEEMRMRKAFAMSNAIQEARFYKLNSNRQNLIRLELKGLIIWRTLHRIFGSCFAARGGFAE